MSTKVTNINALPPGWEDNPEYVYIGRSTRHHSSKGWGNPYPIRVDADRAFVIRMYIKFIDLRLQDGDLPIMTLANKTLVCYCAPKLCHGDILALIVDTIQHSNPPQAFKPKPEERFASSEL